MASKSTLAELPASLAEQLEDARETSWRNLGRRITFYLPGVIDYEGKRGKYPAISITGGRCQLQCAHCRATILEPMIAAEAPEQLLDRCLALKAEGALGCLITGGSLRDGSLPWDSFYWAIRRAKELTGMDISIHTGLIDFETARELKAAGVDHAMLDVVGDDETLLEVCHLDCGVGAIERSLEALASAGLPMVPHVVAGLHFGEMRGELRALEMVSRFNPETLVVVVLMPLPRTPMQGIKPPKLNAIGHFLARARRELPYTPISLGCARPRGSYGYAVEELAIDSGVNRLAVQSDRAITRARSYCLDIVFAESCCSMEASPPLAGAEGQGEMNLPLPVREGQGERNSHPPGADVEGEGSRW